MNDNETTRSCATGSDGRYVALVGGLLLVIIVLLAVLWMRERTGRIAAERRAADAVARYNKVFQDLGVLVEGRAFGDASQPASESQPASSIAR